MRLRWTKLALRDLTSYITYIAEDNPDAADRVRLAILVAIELLLEHPYRGRLGRREGTRELVIGEYPSYLIVYKVTALDIRIIRVWHARQNDR